jgi:hypothetical protein
MHDRGSDVGEVQQRYGTRWDHLRLDAANVTFLADGGKSESGAMSALDPHVSATVMRLV